MVRIPYIKIPSVRVGSIGTASDIGAGGATPAPPTPITYLTQWKIVGNSEVHTDPYLTSWKVSGNSVVDNNTILSCGDLGQDGKYHVKISNGVDIYDIALNEPLRKVNDVADTIEFPSGTEGKALVTRNIGEVDLHDISSWYKNESQNRYLAVYNNAKTPTFNSILADILSAKYTTIPFYNLINGSDDKVIAGLTSSAGSYISFRDTDITDASQIKGLILYELATPTTELVDAPQIAVSPTDTYISANATPYSAFEHTENKEIWSCGEYSATDGKYHILVKPEGGSIADIALDEPLRKVNDVADTIEFANNVAMVTRYLGSYDMGDLDTTVRSDKKEGLFFVEVDDRKYTRDSLLLSAKYTQIASKESINNAANALQNKEYCYFYSSNSQYDYLAPTLYVYDTDFIGATSTEIQTALQGVEVIYELATPTTELVDAPQIEEADSYSMVISQGGKAVSWSSFETDSE